MEYRLVYITVSSADEARKVGKEIVSRRLAACVNILGPIQSMYWWKGNLQEDNEMVVIAKTTAALVPRLIERVKAVHSYEVPCIVALPLTEGNPDFLNWIAQETESPSVSSG